MKRRPIQLLTVAVLLGYGALASASDKSTTIFPAEGSKQCSDYSSNAAIIQMGTTAPLSSGLVSGAENPKDAGTTGESAIYAIDSGKTASFSSSTPVDYAILKSSRDIAVIIYPSGGVTSDANMQLVVANQPLTITALILCYGLGNPVPPPPPPPAKTTIPSCSTLSGIDGVGITCPSNGERSIIYNLELDSAFYNTTNTPIACVCNSAALIECDPGVAYDANNLNNGACPQPVGNKTGAEVTTHIELNNDPYACTTVGGIRKCYSY